MGEGKSREDRGEQLSSDMIEQLIQYMPSPDQMSQIAGLKDEYSTLAESEQFAVVVRYREGGLREREREREGEARAGGGSRGDESHDRAVNTVHAESGPDVTDSGAQR